MAKSKSKLTKKQALWLEHYLICGFNATEAARRAGYAHPNKSGPALANEEHMQDLIAERLKEFKASADEVLFRLTLHSRGSIDYFMDERGYITLASIHKACEDGYGHLLKKVNIDPQIVTYKDRDPDVVYDVKIELHDPQTALSLLGRYWKLFTDKVEHRFDEEQFAKIDNMKSLFQDMRQREQGGDDGHGDDD